MTPRLHRAPSLHRALWLAALILCLATPGQAASIARDLGFGLPTGALDQTSLSVDLDGDGRPDEVSVRADGSDITLRVSLAGSATPTLARFASTQRGVSLIAFDVDGDGDCDVVLSAGPEHRAVAVWENRGHGTFRLHHDGHCSTANRIGGHPGDDGGSPCAPPPSGATARPPAGLVAVAPRACHGRPSAPLAGLPAQHGLARHPPRGPPSLA